MQQGDAAALDCHKKTWDLLTASALPAIFYFFLVLFYSLLFYVHYSESLTGLPNSTNSKRKFSKIVKEKKEKKEKERRLYAFIHRYTGNHVFIRLTRIQKLSVPNFYKRFPNTFVVV